LAQRSADAASEVRILITTSVNQIREGSELVTSSSKTIGELAVNVARVRSAIQDISRSAHEQSRGIVCVNVAIADIDRATQENAALVQTVAELAQRLQADVNLVDHVISEFTLPDAEHLPDA
jgi:methyl-accepting chemotaxis protein